MKIHPLALATFAATLLLVGCKDNSVATQPETAPVEAATVATTPVVTLGEQVRGEISSQNPFNFNDGSRYQLFDLNISADDVAEGNLLEITLRGALNGSLSLFEGDDLIAFSTGYDRNTKLRALVTEGQALKLAVNGANDESFGPFRLSSKILNVAVSLDSSTVYDLPVNASSWLADENQSLRFSVESAGLYRVDLASDEFDTYLTLSGNGVSLENDDGPDGTNSQIITFLEPGEYSLEMRSFSQGTGLFTIAVEEEALPEGVELQNGGDLNVDSEVYGMLSQKENNYRLIVPADGFYEIALSSDSFDAYLELEGQGLYFEDDDSGRGTDALLEVELPAGSYTLTARSFLGHSMGFYSLSVKTITE